MAKLFWGEGIDVVWKKVLKELFINGRESSPRGHKTKELLNVTIEVANGLNNILVSDVRDLNYRFMIAEWIWIQGGLNDVESLATYNAVMRNFSDDSMILSGAYGPRLIPQIPYIIESLNKPDSRQGVATIWTPSPADSKDIPCTISLQWIVRFGHLYCTVNMRSSDAWLGLPYDYFTFSQLTNLISSIIQKPVGSVTMNLCSSHIYEQHWDLGIKSLNSYCSSLSSPQLRGFSSFPSPEFSRAILTGRFSSILEPTPPFRKYKESLSKDKKHCLEVLRELSSK